jgi:magnesium-transporting ATPase (P-type)
MGIAMAITGSEVSREAASLVLLDDRFASVVEGIKRGRIIFASMKKVCTTYIIKLMIAYGSNSVTISGSGVNCETCCDSIATITTLG